MSGKHLLPRSLIEDMNHRKIQEELSAYLDNELSPSRHKQIEAHLRSCSECSEMLAVFQKNRQMIVNIARPVPSTLKDGVMAKIHQQGAQPHEAEPTRTGWIPDIGRWMPDLGRWFFRPVTAGATGILTLVLILGALYFYPTAPQYDETLDLYFGLYTEQLEDNPLKSNVVKPIDATPVDGANAITGAVDDTELFLDLYLENVGD